jgi:LacI family transcriptional regulator
MATQKDVAKAAGVSQATVSLVLNGAGTESIPEKTVKRVLEAAGGLGYRPNRLAQALRTNRTMTLACIIPDITNPFYPSLVRGVLTVAESAGYDVITVNTDGLYEREVHFLELALQGRVDGVIGVFFGLTIRDFKPLVEKEIPVVRLEGGIKSGGNLAVDDIFIDNFAAANDLTQFLINKGHTKIAMIAGRGGPQSVRVQGYKAALDKAELTPVIQLVDAFTEEGGFVATSELLNGGNRPTAIIAANDLMAIGALQSLKQQEISVPDGIAVAGFDDIPAAPLVSPSLTTVNQFQHDLGVKAANMLLERLGGKKNGPGQALEHPYQIIERNTT